MLSCFLHLFLPSIKGIIYKKASPEERWRCSITLHYGYIFWLYFFPRFVSQTQFILQKQLKNIIHSFSFFARGPSSYGCGTLLRHHLFKPKISRICLQKHIYTYLYKHYIKYFIFYKYRIVCMYVYLMITLTFYTQPCSSSPFYYLHGSRLIFISIV